VFTAGLFIAMGGLLVGFDLRTLRQSEPLFTAAWFSLPALVFFGLAVLLLRRLDTRYQFESGEVRAVRRGKVLWRENLTGLTRVTAMEGRSGLIWMKLTWPDHTRWMELYRSVLAEVQRHSDTASGRERRASSGTSRDAPGR
jgi:hypothetical protein